MQSQDNVDGIIRVNLDPSPKTMRLATESDRIMEKLEAAGWSRNLQQKMARGEMDPPGYAAYKKHVHEMANMASTMLSNLEAAGISE